MLVLASIAGCRQSEPPVVESMELVPPTELGATVGNLAQIAQPAPVPVEGYGLVGGLAGAGSGFCPPRIRAYLKQYILTQVPHQRIAVDKLIDSKDTAVVQLGGMIPPTPSQGAHFDVKVTLIPGSEAISIRGGWLYKSDLVAQGTFGADTQPLAIVDGSVFVNPIGTADPDVRTGYILGGGRVLNEYIIPLRLRRSDYRVASVIRNRLSERFGPNVARAVSPGGIELRVPAEYARRKQRFVEMVPVTFLEVTPEANAARIKTFIHRLAVSDDKHEAEVTLEAIGRESLPKLHVLLNSSDTEVRFRAARCMLNLGDDRALGTLRDFATEGDSPYRLEALDAIMVSARRSNAVALAQRLLRDPDRRVMLAAYEHLRRIDDPTIRPEMVGRSFLLEQVAATDRDLIFVSRSGDPRVVLFGAPLPCRDNLFVESPDKTIVVDSRAGQDFVNVTRRHPTRPGVIGPVRTGTRVSDVVRTVGGEPPRGAAGQPGSLGASYAQVIALLEQMAAQDAVAAEFWAGPLPEIALPVKK